MNTNLELTSNEAQNISINSDLSVQQQAVLIEVHAVLELAAHVIAERPSIIVMASLLETVKGASHLLHSHFEGLNRIEDFTSARETALAVASGVLGHITATAYKPTVFTCGQAQAAAELLELAFDMGSVDDMLRALLEAEARRLEAQEQ